MLYLLTKRMRCLGRKTCERERRVGEQKNKRAEGWRLSAHFVPVADVVEKKGCAATCLLTHRLCYTYSPVGAKVFILTVILKPAPVVHGKAPQSPQEPIHNVVGRSCYDWDMQLTRKRTVCNVYIPSICLFIIHWHWQKVRFDTTCQT